MENQKKKTNSLAQKMGISLVCGLVVGILLMFLRESLNGSGQEAVWKTINDLLFQDITAKGAEKALGLFYIIGQLFIRSLQLVIVPMVFTSITLAIGQISDTRTLGRISFKTIAGFLICSFFALVMACVAGYAVYRSGLFNIQVDGLEATAGSTGSNPLNVILNAVPSNITSVFASNTSVLAIVFLAVCLGLCMNVLGEDKTATIKKLVTEVNDIVVVLSAMGKYTDELIQKAKEINPAPPKREMDMLFTIGEQMSVALMAMAMDTLGVRAISLNAFQVAIAAAQDLDAFNGVVGVQLNFGLHRAGAFVFVDVCHGDVAPFIMVVRLVFVAHL